MDPEPAERGRREIEQVLAGNRRFVETFDRRRMDARPRTGLAILACMDARLHVEEVLGLQTGDAHIVRNAGGLATDDAIRSIVVSQELLRTDAILVIGHTRCGLQGRTEEEFREALVARTGLDQSLGFGTFADLEESVRAQVRRLAEHPWIRPVPIRGLVYDVETGVLANVD
ncbi:MAG TPA: carbonic anhydrase [Candidatus Limnocylindrales bacterium]